MRAGWRRAVWLPLILAACHDARRENPFDPELTPAVELQVALNDTAGRATLIWTPYEGEQSFVAYWVLRNIAKSTEMDTLAKILEVGQTSFVDSLLAPNTAYVYRVAVVNASGFVVPSPERTVQGYAAQPVTLLSADVDTREATVHVRWSRFRGGRFIAYRVERRNAVETDFDLLTRSPAQGDTVFSDTTPAPETTYFYRIAVEAAGQRWTSNRAGPLRLSLTPVALLAAAADPIEGAIELTWTRYTGPDFQTYHIRRRLVGTDAEEDVYQTTSPGDTTFTDQTVLADVDYVYTVVVQAGNQERFSNSLQRRLTLPPVQIQRLDFDATTASAILEWTRYAGPRFRAYRVVRRTEEFALQTIAEVEDIAVTSFTDTGLAGNTEYFYRVVVLTEQDEEVESAEQSGMFHPLLETWPLEVEAGDFVRLYIEEEDRVTVLVSSPNRVRLLFFDPQGMLLAACGKTL